VLHTARWKCRTQKIAKNSPSWHHHTTLSGYIFATKAPIDNQKKVIKQQYLPTCPHNMVNFGPLAAEIVSLVWGTPANFNGFRVVASLLQQRRSTESNQTLHDVWLSPWLVHYIYIFGGSCPATVFCQVQSSLCVQVLRFPILAALLDGTRSERQPKFAELSRGRHLYSVRRPSRWALAHILVDLVIS